MERSDRLGGVLVAVLGVIERATSTDLMALAADRPRSPAAVAAVLLLDAGSALSLAAAQEAIADRIQTVPRLRQRLVRPPFGCGRPVWVDDPGFDIRDHVGAVRCPPPGDVPALLEVAAECITRQLLPGKPLWAATLVTHLSDGGAALIVVFHHVLADGIGGLAVLARLVDGAPPARAAHFPQGPPARRDLFVDALGSRLRALTQLSAGIRRLRAATAELAPGGVVSAPRSSLNRRTGARRSLAVALVDLASIQRTAHAYGGTVNDVVLTAVTGALHTLLKHRGETVDRFVISVPVSARREATATHLGNEVGVIPISLPGTGDPLSRLTAIVELTRARKMADPGSSAALLAPAFRILAKLGLFQWFVDRQRAVTTFVTNLRGPDTRLLFLGSRITGVIPVGSLTGNVTVAFAVLSYAGTLTVTVVADPERCPDLPLLAVELQRELDTVTLADRGPPGSSVLEVSG